MAAVASATRWCRRSDVVATTAPIIIITTIIISRLRPMTSIRHRQGPPGPLPPLDRARCYSLNPWRGPALPCHLPATASTPWSIRTGRILPIRRMIRPIAWNRTAIGCYRTVLPAHWRIISRGSDPIAASKAWTRARRTRASAKRPCRMVSRLCT